jgi:hypothetical protein
MPGVKHHVFKKEVTGAPIKKRSMLVRPEAEAQMHVVPDAATDVGVAVDAKVVPVNCSSHVISPDCLRALYNLPAIDRAFHIMRS